MSDLLSTLYLAVGWQPYTWFALLVLASLLDAATTVYALRQSGTREANPVMRWVMGKLGTVPALLVIKAVPLLALFYALQGHILYVPLGVAVYAAAALWNLFAVYRSDK